MTLPAVLRPRVLTLQSSGYWFIGFLVLALMAFWPRYLSLLPSRIDIYTHVHAALMTMWCGLLIAQPFLIRGGRRAWHRLLGRASYGLVPALIVTWLLMIHVRAAALPDDVFEREGTFFYLPVQAAVLFVAAWGMAIVRRRTTPLHARYMVCTALGALDAVTGRLLFYSLPPLSNVLLYSAMSFAVTDAILLGLYVIDRSPHRRAFAHMLLLFVPVHLFFFTGAQTAVWLDIVRWFRSLPLT